MNNADCTFYIVRHGQTDWNAQELIQGHRDIHLNEVGIQQAKTLAKDLQNIHFDAVFSSDLQRAKKTAEIIVLEKKLLVETTNRLRERQFGTFEGKPVHTNKKLIVELLEKMQKSEVVEDQGLESDEKVLGRLITFLREVAVAFPSKNVLIVAHGGIMQALLIHLGFYSYKNAHAYWISNTAHIKLRSDGVDFFIDETIGIQLLPQE